MKEGTRRRQIFLGLAGLAITVLLACWGLLYSRGFRSWLEEDLSGRLSRALGRRCELRVERLRPHALELELSDVRIAADQAAGESLLSIQEIKAKGRWRSLLRGRLELSELSIAGLHADLAELATGARDDVVPASRPAGWLGPVVIHRLRVRDSGLRLAGPRIPVTIDAEGVQLEAVWRQQAAGYRGSLHSAASRVRGAAVGDFPVDLRAGFTLTENMLTLDAVELIAPGLDLRADARYGVDSALQAVLAWVARPAEMPVPWLATIGAGGVAEGEVRVEGTGASIAAQVEVRGSDLIIRSLPIESLNGELLWTREGLRVTAFDVRGGGLEVDGEGQLGSWEVPLQASLAFRAPEIGPLLLLAGGPERGMAGSLEGELSLAGSELSWSALRGRYRVRADGLHPRSLPQRVLRADVRGRFAESAVELEAAELAGSGVSLSASGVWRWLGRSDLSGKAQVDDWGAVSDWLREAGLNLERRWPYLDLLGEIDGAVEAELALSVPSEGRPAVEQAQGSLSVKARQLIWKDRPGQRSAIDLRAGFDRGQVRLEHCRIEIPGLSATLTGPRTATPVPRYAVELQADEIATAIPTLLPFLRRAEVDPRWVNTAGRAAGALSLSGSVVGLQPGAALADLTGSVEIALRSISLGAAPDDLLSGDLNAAFAAGELELRRFEASLAGFEVEGEGRLGLDRVDNLDVRLAASDLAASTESLRTLLEELSLAPAGLGRLPPIGGELGAELRLDGLWREPSVLGRLSVRRLQVADQGWGRLEAKVVTENRSLQYRARIGEQGRDLEVEGELGPGLPRQVTLRARLRPQPLAPYAALAGLADRTSGLIEGEVRMAWPERRGSGRLKLLDGSIAGVAVELLDTEWTLRGDELEITSGQLQMAGGRLSFGGRLGVPSGSSRLEFEGQDIRLGDLASAAELPLDVEANVSLEGQVTGSVKNPHLEAVLGLRDTRVLRRPTPDLSGPVSLDSAGLRIELSSADETASASWAMEFGEEGRWRAGLDYPIRVALDRWLFGDRPASDSIVEGILRGDLEMPAGRPGLAVGSMRFDNGRLAAAGYTLRLVDGLEALLTSERIRVDPFRMEGKGTALTVEADLIRQTTPGLSLRARGLVDLRILQALTPRLRASGAATIDLEAGGTLPAVDWRGTVSVTNGAIQHLGFPAALEGVEARAELRPDEWSLRELDARLGGGPVAASGTVAIAGLRPGDYRFEIQGDGVRLDYPEGFRSQLDASLVLGRSGAGATVLNGEITVLRGLYDRDLGLERQVLARRRGLDGVMEIGRSWTDRVTLDLSLRAPEGLWVRNDLAFLETRGELRVQGVLSRPRLSGRIQAIEGGQIFFREVSYYVTQGSFDYLGDPIADPRLAIRAETSVAEYDVTLTVSGRLSEPIFELSSSPPLPVADIVALLLSGSTRDQFAAGSGGLSQAQAASYLTSGLAKRLESSLSRSLGLDELQLDPVLVEGQTNPTARVTVGKTITPRLSATYSSRLGTGQQDVYQAKFRLNERLKLVGTRDDDGSLSADVRYSERRYQGNRERPGAGVASEPQPTIDEIHFSGYRVADEGKLRRLLSVRPGERFRRSRLLEGTERIRQWYIEQGFPEIDTAYRILEADGRFELDIRIEEGRRVRLRFEGVGRPKRLERAVYEFWSRSLFREEVARDAAARVEEILAEDGFLSARAKGQLLELEPGVVEAFFLVERGPRVRVTGLEFQGPSFFTPKELRKQILTQPGLLRPTWLRPGLVSEDAEAIRALYVSHGFLQAGVQSQIEYPKSKRRAVLRFAIEEGPRYSLRQVGFMGNSELPTEALAGAARLESGGPYRDQPVQEAEARLRELYDEQGFADVQIVTEAEVDRAAQAVDLIFTVDEGARQVVEVVEIHNEGITRESVVRREIELSAGDPLNRELLSRSQYNLYRTGLFRSVNLEPLPGSSAESRRLRVTVDEARNVQTEIGVGFDSEEGPRVNANLAHTNLGGGRLYAGVGGRWSEVDKRFQLLARNPSMGGSRIVGLASVFWEDEEQENFVAERTGFSLQLGRDYLDDRLTANVGFDLTDLDDEQTVTLPSEDPSDGAESVRLASLRSGLARSTRDSSFWPSSGFYARAEASLFHSALTSEVEFARLFTQWSHYGRLRRDAVWSFGFRTGLAEPFGISDELPISERYFAGGESSLRGFARDSLVASGTPADLVAGLGRDESLGGNALFLLNQELVVPLLGAVHGVVFYDVGNLYWRLEDFDPTDLRQSAGLGLRMRSPFGPIRAEYGWKLDRRENESAGRFHFSIGMPF